MNDDVERRLSQLERDREAMARSRWFAPARNGIAQIENRDALPAASPDLAFCVVGLRDATDDLVYVCLKVASTWTWVSIT